MRLVKQLLYGGVLILIIAGAAVWIYRGSIFIAPTCSDGIQNQTEEGIDCGAICGISCEQKYLKELSYSNPQVFRLGDFASVYFDLDNPNQNFGLKNFKYTMDFYSSTGKLLKSIEGQSFIYPGQNKDSKSGNKKIIEAGLRVIGDIKSVKISFSNINWEPSSEFRSMKLENQNMKTSKEGDFFIISGAIKNLVSFTVPQVVINAFLKDASGKILGVSKNELSQLLPFEEREYKVSVAIEKDSEPSVDFSSTEAFIYPIY
ncbi:MAG: hypothetical protein AAB626_01575 [Patescibacteria group bacterium]